MSFIDNFIRERRAHVPLSSSECLRQSNRILEVFALREPYAFYGMWHVDAAVTSSMDAVCERLEQLLFA
jgi:hypothetical protein